MTMVAWDGAICQSNWVMTCEMMLCRNIDEVRNTLYQYGFLLGRARFVNDENGSLGLSEKYVFAQCANSIGKVLNLQRYPTPTTIGVNGGLGIATDPGLHQVRAHVVGISRVLRYFPESYNFALMRWDHWSLGHGMVRAEACRRDAGNCSN
ncbi:predicted protein [Histoplasma capsulatum var. duboisii H88]|uniref:Predicted protein n=2 Tax=Ajellomyces capsulatus TaxID=5037 RepID=F0UFF7_AJEC8|nr:predicted protein [Histoplasma capsulatum H143]EGC44117.1 predicted protein [Histoplasma capsulatum var. duboisii H88]